MNCDNTNPCSDPCTDCLQTNGCYQDCGCLNPTTHGCITNPGTGLTYIGVTNDMDGEQVLSAINSKFGEVLSQISAIQVPTSNIADIFSKIDANDTTTGYLDQKIAPGNGMSRSIINAGGNEIIRLNVDPSKLVSTDTRNQLTVDAQNKLLVLNASDGTETKLIDGNGITISGVGSIADPYIISTSSSILQARGCFDGIWRAITLQQPITNPNVTYISGQPQYRIRYDGSIEFKGNITFTVLFQPYTDGNRKQVANVASIPATCLSVVEQNGITEMKSISYIDAPQAAADQITQTYNYIIKKNSNNIIVEFNSSFSTATSKQIIVSFDGCISHPSF